MEYHEYFKVGDTVRALRRVEFIDGTIHEQRSIHTVKEEDSAYFNVAHIDYEWIAGLL